MGGFLRQHMPVGGPVLLFRLPSLRDRKGSPRFRTLMRVSHRPWLPLIGALAGGLIPAPGRADCQRPLRFDFPLPNYHLGGYDFRTRVGSYPGGVPRLHLAEDASGGAGTPGCLRPRTERSCTPER